jgi:hypothetical protein
MLYPREADKNLEIKMRCGREKKKEGEEEEEEEKKKKKRKRRREKKGEERKEGRYSDKGFINFQNYIR